MRKLLTLLVAVLAFAGCSKEETKLPAKVEVEIRYFEHDGRPFAPDNGSSVYLLEYTYDDYTFNYESMMRGEITLGNGNVVKAKYTAITDAEGVAKFEGVKQGKYFIVAAGKGAEAFSYKTIDINSTYLKLTKTFSWESRHEDKGETWDK